MKLEVEDISKSYGRIQVLSHVSFSCEAGTIMGYIGPNGSGKPTTLKVIAALVRPDEGSVLIDGRPYRSLENPGRKLGFLLDPGAHHPGRSVRETVMLAAMMMPHLLNELETYIDKAVILDRGRVVSDQTLRRGAVDEWSFVSGPDLDEIETALVAKGFEHRRAVDGAVGPGFRVRSTSDEIGEAMWERRVRVSRLGPATAMTLEARYDAVTSPQFRAGCSQPSKGEGEEA